MQVKYIFYHDILTYYKWWCMSIDVYCSVSLLINHRSPSYGFDQMALVLN